MSQILIVDDDDTLPTLISEELSLRGIDPDVVVFASSGEDGIEEYKKIAPMCVLLDMRMPGINGAETFERIKEFDNDASVILMTGYIQDKLVDNMIKHGVDGYISKSCNHYIQMVGSIIIAILEIGEDPTP
jgi:CheY-like chemotaxis protein